MKEVDKFIYHTVTGTMELEFYGETVEKMKFDAHMSREEVEEKMKKMGWDMGDQIRKKLYTIEWMLY